MRLIDADALVKQVQYSKEDNPYHRGAAEHRPLSTLWCVGHDHFKAIIDAAPTIDAEPVRHGQWIQSKTVPSYHSCSYCKRPHNMPKSCNVYVLPYYCMDCGAKMDAEVGKRGSDD